MTLESEHAKRWDVPVEHLATSSYAAAWGGLDAAEVVHPEDDFTVPAFARHLVVFNLATTMAAVERRADRATQLGPAKAMVLPAGRERTWHLEHEGEVRHLHVYLDTDLVDRTAAGLGLDPAVLDLQDGFGVQDPLLEQLARLLRAELLSGGLGGDLYGESLGVALAIHLIRSYASRPPEPQEERSLDPRVLRQALTYIEDHLAMNLSLQAVAGAVHLSPYHFARRFKLATGSTVHQYVLRRRVEHARALLQTTSWPVSLVAQRAGFANASHLSSHLRRLLGVTPATLRAGRART